MKTITILKTVIAAGLIAGISQVSIAADANKKVVYKGDESARSICVSIADDKVNQLNRSLKSQKISRLDNDVHTRFTCNGVDLLSFAEQMGSHKAAEYLAPKFDHQDTQFKVVSN